jgi:hypothetical protein
VSAEPPPPDSPTTDTHPDNTDSAADLRTDDLESEQVHLDESRAALARMRARTESLDSAAAGDWVSREFLESAFAARRKALADDPTVPLFFGRVDYLPDAADVGGESFHVGRRHVSDARTPRRPSGAPTTQPPRPSRATPGWPRCCPVQCGRT